MRALRQRVAASPVVELVGAIGPSGASLGKAGGDARWTLRCRLDRWRIGAGEINAAPLTLLRDVADAEKGNWRAPLRPYAVLRFRVRFGDDAPQAFLEEILGEVADAAALCPSFYRADIVQNANAWDRFVARARTAFIAFLQRPERAAA